MSCPNCGSEAARFRQSTDRGDVWICPVCGHEEKVPKPQEERETEE